MSSEFESGFFVREPAWHGLGKVINFAPCSKDALRLADLDWTVESRPIYDGFGNEIKHFKANMRTSDNEVLGVVKERYRIIQNSEAFNFVDDLLGEGVKFESAGSLKNGRTIWMLARMEGVKILGDDITPYMCFTNTHSGEAPVRVCMTDIRVVCNNTLSLALKTAPRIWSARHMGDIKGKTLDAMETLGLATQYNGALNDYAEEMVKEKLSQTEQQAIIDGMFPTPDDATPRQKASVQKVKDEFMICMLAPDLANFLNTRWQIIQAATDFVSHREPKRQSTTYKENVWSSLINGNALLDRTVALCNA